MIKHRFFIRIFQLLLFLINPCFFLSIICERLGEKIETKVDIEITYLHRFHEDNPQEPQKYYTHRVTQLIHNNPHYLKSPITEGRVNNRQSNNNNRGNNRHGYSFTSIDKNPIASYDNDGSDTPTRNRAANSFSGQLIHLTTLSGQSDNSSNVPFLIHTACQETINSVTNGWIALVQSGSCTVLTKLGQIRKLHYQPTAVIIYGDEKVIEKKEPYLSFNQDETPMVIFLPWDNVKGIVQRCYNSSGQLNIPPELLPRINISSLEGPFSYQKFCNVSIKIYTSSDDNLLNKTSVLFVSISFILLMVISLAWLMFYYVQRFRYIHTKEQFSRRLAHMAKKAVAKIPVKTLKQGDRETDPDLDNCAICIECYKPSDTVRILPCKHYFHKSCIDPWLLEQRSCPMCKLNILHAYGFLPNERGSIISEDHLSDLDSSLELQFMSGNIVPPLPSTSTRVQAYCQARDNNYINVATLPPIFTEPGCRGNNRWSSLLLKRPQRVSHRIDRSVSLRHLSGSAEERITFLSHNRLLSHSATDTTVTIQDPPTSIPQISPPLIWQNNNNNDNITTSVTAAINPGSQSTISSH